MSILSKILHNISNLIVINEYTSLSNEWVLKNKNCYNSIPISGGLHKVFQIKRITHRSVEILPKYRLATSIKLGTKKEIVDTKYFLQPLKESCTRNGMLQDRKNWGKTNDPLTNIWVEINKEITNFSKDQYSIRLLTHVKDTSILKMLYSQSSIFNH